MAHYRWEFGPNQTGAVPYMGEVDALWQPLQQQHHVNDERRLRFAAGRQCEYIAQHSHGSLCR